MLTIVIEDEKILFIESEKDLLFFLLTSSYTNR